MIIIVNIMVDKTMYLLIIIEFFGKIYKEATICLDSWWKMLPKFSPFKITQVKSPIKKSQVS